MLTLVNTIMVTKKKQQHIFLAVQWRQNVFIKKNMEKEIIIITSSNRLEGIKALYIFMDVGLSVFYCAELHFFCLSQNVFVQ